MTKQVRATKTGFFGGVMRNTGEVFAVPESLKLGKWLELVSPVEKAAPAKPSQPAVKSSPKPAARGKGDDSDLA